MSPENSPKKSRRLPVPDEAEIQPPAPTPVPSVAKSPTQPARAAPRPAAPPAATKPRPTTSPPASREQPRRAPQYDPSASPSPSSGGISSAAVMLFGVGAIVAVLSIVVNLVRDEFAGEGGETQEQIASIVVPPNVADRETSASVETEVDDAVAKAILPEPVAMVDPPAAPVATVDPPTADTNPVAPEVAPPPAIEVTWTCEKGFPFDYAVALKAMENAKESHDDNVLHKKQEIQQCEQLLAKTLDDARRKRGRESTRLMVVDANPDAVTAIADVTAGWLIDVEENFVGRHWFTGFGRQTGVTWLKSIGDEERPTIVLRAGSQIDAAVAKTLVWGDRIIVSFKVQGIEAPRTRRLPRSSLSTPLTVVTVSDLKCLESQPRQKRSTVWPDEGTLPRVLCQQPRLTAELAPIIGETLPLVAAKLKVEKVTEQKIYLVNELYPSSAGFPIRLRLRPDADELALPIRAVGKDVAAGLGDYSRIAVQFRVKKLEPFYLTSSDRFGYAQNKPALAAAIEGLEFVSVVRLRPEEEGVFGFE